MKPRRYYRTHFLKTHREFFERVLSGAKTWELRVNDRGFSFHDLLILREWDAKRREYTSRELARVIVGIDYLDSIGLRAWVHLDLARPPAEEP